jgi:hypothetical protein
MRSGIAGINIVSAYITMVATRLNTASTFQAYDGIFIGGADAAEVVVLIFRPHYVNPPCGYSPLFLFF